MARMVRKQLYIELRQESVLKHIMRETGMSESELIRQAIDHWGEIIHFPRDLEAWQDERTFITKLIEKGPVQGERTWKREDLHDR